MYISRRTAIFRRYEGNGESFFLLLIFFSQQQLILGGTFFFSQFLYRNHSPAKSGFAWSIDTVYDKTDMNGLHMATSRRKAYE